MHGYPFPVAANSSSFRMRFKMRPRPDCSKELRRMVADGRAINEALTELHAAGASVADRITAVGTFRRCTIAEAGRIVVTLSALSEKRAGTSAPDMGSGRE